MRKQLQGLADAVLPSSLLGALLLLFLLTPGLAHVLRREQAVPEVQRSVFRETVQVVTASAVSLFITGLIFAAARAVWPERTLNVRGLIRAPGKLFLEHHVQGDLVGRGVPVRGDPHRLARRRSADPGYLKRSPAWYEAAHLFRDDEPGLIQVGAQFDDGTYVVGYLDHHKIDTGETADRDMLLPARSVW